MNINRKESNRRLVPPRLVPLNVDSIRIIQTGEYELEPAAYQLLLRISTGFLEGICGKRPMQQLSVWLNEWEIQELLQLRPKFAWASAHLATIRVCLPTRYVVESVVRIELRDRSFVCTIRLEQHNAKWICTHFALLAPNGLVRQLPNRRGSP